MCFSNTNLMITKYFYSHKLYIILQNNQFINFFSCNYPYFLRKICVGTFLIRMKGCPPFSQDSGDCPIFQVWKTRSHRATMSLTKDQKCVHGTSRMMGWFPGFTRFLLIYTICRSLYISQIHINYVTTYNSQMHNTINNSQFTYIIYIFICIFYKYNKEYIINSYNFFI